MKIKVTQEHFDKGYWHNPLNNSITLTLKEAGFKSVEVYRYNIYIGYHKIPIDLPFKQVEPFEFEIKLPLLLRIRRYFNAC